MVVFIRQHDCTGCEFARITWCEAINSCVSVTMLLDRLTQETERSRLSFWESGLGEEWGLMRQEQASFQKAAHEQMSES